MLILLPSLVSFLLLFSFSSLGVSFPSLIPFFTCQTQKRERRGKKKRKEEEERRRGKKELVWQTRYLLDEKVLLKTGKKYWIIEWWQDELRMDVRYGWGTFIHISFHLYQWPVFADTTCIKRGINSCLLVLVEWGPRKSIFFWALFPLFLLLLSFPPSSSSFCHSLHLPIFCFPPSHSSPLIFLLAPSLFPGNIPTTLLFIHSSSLFLSSHKAYRLFSPTFFYIFFLHFFLLFFSLESMSFRIITFRNSWHEKDLHSKLNQDKSHLSKLLHREREEKLRRTNSITSSVAWIHRLYSSHSLLSQARTESIFFLSLSRFYSLRWERKTWVRKTRGKRNRNWIYLTHSNVLISFYNRAILNRHKIKQSGKNPWIMVPLLVLPLIFSRRKFGRKFQGNAWLMNLCSCN